MTLKINGIQTWDGKATKFSVSGYDESGNTQETRAFSIEPDQPYANAENINLGVTLVSPSQIRNGLKIAWLYENADTYSGEALDKEKTGALQLAIWEVMSEEEGNYSLDSGHFIVNNSKGLGTLAEIYLTALNENFATADTAYLDAAYTVALHPAYQDLVIKGDICAPSVPENPEGTATGGTEVEISWTASTDNSGGTINYEIYRNGISVASVTETVWSEQTVV